ncbi:hypothetical protein V2H45_13220 [Tumidithrix elongata RA019]|uniref:Uncharacterized protein n=1 Tax=Tumidithrix elongata BACA0141 TaxID=2716417 RepID=A0AAW9PT55_9CYAN|nr:hypothetical protein [Tumidithrix elongata RA019]
MFQTKPNFTLAIALAIACITIPDGLRTTALMSLALPANSSSQDAKIVNKADKSAECKAFTTIVDKASGARNTMDPAVALRYVDDLKQDLLALKVEDAQLKSLHERYLQFAVDMGGKLERVKRDQAQGDYAALMQAMPMLTATGNKGIDLEQELLQYCGKS